jgi:hypothetical protein
LNKTPNSRNRTDEKYHRGYTKEKSKNTNNIINNNNVIPKNFSSKIVNNKFDKSRNCSPGIIRQSNVSGKTPVKNINNIPFTKRNNIEDNNISIITTRETRNNNHEENNKSIIFDPKKNFLNNKLKSQGKIKAIIPTGNGLRNEINNKITKKINEKIEVQINSKFNLSKNYNIESDNKRLGKFRYTYSDLLDAEKEFNISNLIQIQSEITDDLLLNNKEDQLLNSLFNKNSIIIEDSFTDDIHPFNIKNINANLEIEEILDDKWNDISKYLSLKDIALLSITNKKIGKNAISEIIQKLQKEKYYYEEKILSSVNIYIFVLHY